MSLNHSHTISAASGDEVRINISCLDDTPQQAEFMSGNLFAFGHYGNAKFTSQFSIHELRGLYQFLNQYSVIRDADRVRTGMLIEIDDESAQLMALFSKTNKPTALHALESIVSSQLSREDINTILGRKTALQQFGQMLANPNPHTEPEWQRFLEANDWIFGYGLNYRYLGLLQREARVSGTDLAGGGSVISDFLMSDSRFTKLVELKRPDTLLFENVKNRADSWRLSSDITYAVSQILAQKANWEVESRKENFDAAGNKIYERTVDPECILIIGTSQQFAGEDRENIIKKKTFELYRRNLRHIDILLYDEIFERAKALVESDEAKK